MFSVTYDLFRSIFTQNIIYTRFVRLLLLQHFNKNKSSDTVLQILGNEH